MAILQVRKFKLSSFTLITMKDNSLKKKKIFFVKWTKSIFFEVDHVVQRLE